MAAGQPGATEKINSVARAFFSADADRENRARAIWRGTVASRFCRLSLYCVYAEFHFRPDRRAFAGAVGENPDDDSGFNFAHNCDLAHLASRRRSVGITNDEEIVCPRITRINANDFSYWSFSRLFVRFAGLNLPGDQN